MKNKHKILFTGILFETNCIDLGDLIDKGTQLSAQ